MSALAAACGPALPIGGPGVAGGGSPPAGVCVGCPDQGFYCRLSSNTCEPGCGFDSQCERGQVCDENLCVPGCRGDAACDPGTYCAGGQCVAGCRSSSTCPSGQSCDTAAKACVATCTSSSQCAQDSMCTSASVCAPGCTDSSNCAAGKYCAREGRCEPGLRWTSEKTAAPEGEWLMGVGGSGSSVYAVGYGGRIFHSKGDGAWTAQQSGVTTWLGSVWASGPGDVWVTGEKGTLLRSTGDGRWTKVPIPGWTSYEDLGPIWGAAPSDFWVMGRDWVLYHHRNGSWTTEHVPGVGYSQKPYFTAAHGLPTGELCVVGGWSYTGFVACRGASGGWSSSIPFGWSSPPTGVLMRSSSEVWVLISGSLYRWTIGSSDDPEYVDRLNSAHNLWANSPTDLHADGLFWHSKGDGTWTERQPRGLTTGGAGLWGPGPGELYRLQGVTILHGRNQ